MITVRLKGGMGNQMFQYAFGKAMAARLGTSVNFDCSLLLDRARGKEFVYRDYDLDIFNVDAQFSVEPSTLRTLYKLRSSTLSRYIKKWAAKGKPIFKEPHFEVSEQLLTNPVNNQIYDGWWQGHPYFDSITEQLRNDFTFKTGVLPGSAELHNKITATNSICLNVRRTDFLTTPALNATNLEYFLRGAEHMATLVEQPHFFVFSDDVEWCRENIQLPHPVEVVEHSHKGHKFGNYLQLLAACKHFIIPNSSFAWWAVWLNGNTDKHVIAPKNWFNEGDYDTRDLVPQNWIRL